MEPVQQCAACWEHPAGPTATDTAVSGALTGQAIECVFLAERGRAAVLWLMGSAGSTLGEGKGSLWWQELWHSVIFPWGIGRWKEMGIQQVFACSNL